MNGDGADELVSDLAELVPCAGNNCAVVGRHPLGGEWVALVFHGAPAGDPAIAHFHQLTCMMFTLAIRAAERASKATHNPFKAMQLSRLATDMMDVLTPAPVIYTSRPEATRFNYLLWSVKHKAWWRSARSGYTRDPGEAGAYTADEAAEIVLNAAFNMDLGMAVIPLVDTPAARAGGHASPPTSERKG